MGSALIVSVTLLLLASVAHVAGVRLNLSGSIPPGIYRLAEGPIDRGALVLACLPTGVASLARDREYVLGGSCDDGNAPVGKTVVAVGGDTIDVTIDGVFVDGRLVRNSAPLSRDSRGRALPFLRLAHHAVGRNEIWLVSSYSLRSFDSRYFGGVSRRSIISRIQPLMPSR